MAEPRAPHESEVQAVIGFLDEHLRPGVEWSIASEYPTVFHQNNIENLRIISDDTKVLAHAATKYFVVKTTAGLFKVAAIGSVLTDPQVRNKGLSQNILQSALKAAEAECADFAILWTDLYDFYRKLGFELAGTEISVVINGTTTNTTDTTTTPTSYRTDLKILKTEKVSPESILKLYSQHTCATVRTADEIRRYLQIPNSRVYTAWSPSNQLLAYAIEGKGADLKGYVHEWAGGVDALMPLFEQIFKDHGGPLTILTPAHSENLCKHLRTWNCFEHRGYLGMIRPISYDLFFMKIHRHARNHGIADFVLEKTTDGFRIGRGKDVVTLASVQELTRLIFGPVDTQTLTPEFQKIFPIPMWAWGWDSV